MAYVCTRRRLVAFGATMAIVAAVTWLLWWKGLGGSGRTHTQAHTQEPVETQAVSPTQQDSGTEDSDAEDRGGPLLEPVGETTGSTATEGALGGDDESEGWGSILPVDDEQDYDPNEPPSTTTVPNTLCYASTTEELGDAVEYDTCETVVLTSPRYEIEREIIVRRNVVVQGSPRGMPVLNAEGSPRNFRVKANAYLTMRYVRMIPSEASTQPTRRLQQRRRSSRSQRGQREATPSVDDSEAYTSTHTGTHAHHTPHTPHTHTPHTHTRMLKGNLSAHALGGNGTAQGDEGGFLDPLNPFIGQGGGNYPGGRSRTDPDTSKPLYVRGGCVYLESGASGALFEYVYFVDAPDPALAVESAIRNTLNQRRIRVFGGMVLSVDAPIDFIGCLFYDVAWLFPITDALHVGGQILMLRGRVTLTACVFRETNFFGPLFAIGTNIAVLAGELIMSFISLQESNLAIDTTTIGDTYFVGAGVAVFTGLARTEHNVLYTQKGTGMHTMLAGVMVQTGWTNEENIVIGAGYGLGFEIAMGAGLNYIIGMSLHEFNGIFTQATAGEAIFTGAGEMVMIGSNLQDYCAIRTGKGMANDILTLAGDMTIIGTALIEMFAVFTYMGVGEVLAMGSGLLTFYGGYIFTATAIEAFIGFGEVAFVGTGALVLADTTIETYQTSLSTPVIDIWVQGSCNPPEDAGVRRKTHTRAHTHPRTHRHTHTHTHTHTRVLQSSNVSVAPYPGLPVFVTGGLGCDYSGRIVGNSGNNSRALAGGTHTHTHTDPHTHAHRSTHTRTRARAHAHTHDSASTDREGKRRDTLARDQLAGISTENVSIYLAGIKRNETVNDLSKLNLPPGTTQLLSAAKNQMSKLNKNLGLSTRETAHTDALLHVESVPSGSCTAYVDSNMVEGPGALACDVTPPTTAPEPSQSSPVDPKAVFTPHTLINCQLQPTSRPSVGLNDTLLQSAVNDATQQWRQAHNITEDVRAKVFSSVPTFPDEAWAAMEELGVPVFDTHTPAFKVVYVVTSPEVRDALVGALQEPSDRDFGETVMGSLVKEQLDTQGLDVDLTGLAFESTFEIPAYDEASMVNETNSTRRRRLGGTNTLTLLEPQAPALHTTEVEFEKQYVIQLTSFRPRTRVDIALHNMDSDEDGTALLSIDIGEEGLAQVPYVLTSKAVAPGEYFLEGTSDGVLTHSQAFTVSDRQRKRRLFGPSVYL